MHLSQPRLLWLEPDCPARQRRQRRAALSWLWQTPRAPACVQHRVSCLPHHGAGLSAWTIAQEMLHAACTHVALGGE